MSLKAHLLNVGHGDCTFVEHPSGRLSMIDINNSKSIPEEDAEALKSAFAKMTPRIRMRMSWEDYYRSLMVDPYDYYQEHFSGQTIWRYIQTHPDMDHMTGLYKFFWQEKVRLSNFWDTDHAKTKTKADFEGSPYNYNDWWAYQQLRQGEAADGRTVNVIRAQPGDSRDYWKQDKVNVLAPSDELLDLCDLREEWNNASYVLRVTHGGRALLLPGDAVRESWDWILKNHDDDQLKSSVLKAAHHGRESGFHAEAMEAVQPKIVLCSVGKKPDTDASDEYAALGATVLSTRYHGTITVEMHDDGSVNVQDRNGDDIASLPALPRSQ